MRFPGSRQADHSRQPKSIRCFLPFLLLLLAACGESHEQMLRHLEELERINRADSLMQNDTLAEQLVQYFDRYGDSNERMRAHYILGRTYADMGEAPKAIDCYYNALSQADTTATGIDYNTLLSITGQLAVIFHQQNLPQDEIRAIKQYIHYVQKAYPNDTLKSLLAQRQLIKPYYLLGEKDTVLQIINCINNQLEQIGHHQEAACGLGTAIYIYTERGQLDMARQLLDKYEQESKLFDAQGNISKGREDYYWIKGLFELAAEQIDSAEHYFRKGILYGTYEAVSSSYKGMLAVYQHKQNLDSVILYSHLSEAALDSLHKQMQTDAIHQASTLYNYTRSEKKAEREAKEKQEAWYWFWSLLAGVTILIILFIYLYKKYQKEKQENIRQLTTAFSISRAEQQNVKLELDILKSRDYDHFIADKEKKELELKHYISVLEKEIGKSKDSKQENNFADFKNSQIVSIFRKKAQFTKEHPLPNKSEWNALSNQFVKDMPSLCQLFFNGKKLSELEFRACILLVLDFEEGVIVGLTQTSSSAISIAKRRANHKLFNEKTATTLKYNLKKAYLRPFDKNC